MKLPIAAAAAIAALLLSHLCLRAQEPGPLPDKLAALQQGYQAAVARATAPLARTYQQELEKLRAEYLRAGDTAAAHATETLLKALLPPGTAPAGGSIAPGAIPLAQMSAAQFKQWLATVVISERSEFMNSYTYDGTTFTSTRQGSRTPREHKDVTIEPGRIFVPFTSTNATIVIDPGLTRAQVTYSTGGRHEATITPKARP